MAESETVMGIAIGSIGVTISFFVVSVVGFWVVCSGGVSIGGVVCSGVKGLVPNGVSSVGGVSPQAKRERVRITVKMIAVSFFMVFPPFAVDFFALK